VKPGVGKTVLVEALAQMINDATVPITLMNKRILLLDMRELLRVQNSRENSKKE
jgi:ATP-dependent Clp protease ATP-binding subunit ClpA